MSVRPKFLKSDRRGERGADAMAKGQVRSNKEVRKPKAETPEKPNASKPSRKTLGISKT